MNVERNTSVNAIGRGRDDFDRISKEIDGLGLHIVAEQLTREAFVCPFHGFFDQGDSTEM